MMNVFTFIQYLYNRFLNYLFYGVSCKMRLSVVFMYDPSIGSRVFGVFWRFGVAYYIVFSSLYTYSLAG